MITVADLKNAGYRSYPSNPSHPDATCFYQKVVWDKSNKYKKYFINICGYDLSKWNIKESSDLVFCFEARFYAKTKDGDELSFDTQLNDTNKGLTVEDIEQFFEDIWQRMGCDIDKHNN